MKPIARIYTNLTGKFGVPRQSGVVPTLSGRIVFKPEYRMHEAFRGLEEFSHIWVIWEFSEAKQADEDSGGFSPTVRPPRLGGNKRIGVFATRSPFRPNNLGLSVVKLEGIEFSEKDGPVLHVSGIDMMSGTPIYDIKPYIPYADWIPDATSGFVTNLEDLKLDVVFPNELLLKIPSENHKEILQILSNDPRPQYQSDPERVYALTYLGRDIKFKISEKFLTVVDVIDVLNGGAI